MLIGCKENMINRDQKKITYIKIIRKILQTKTIKSKKIKFK